MPRPVILLSIPGLRPADVRKMPVLSELAAAGRQAALVPSFPCVTWPVQANMLTGRLPCEHGIVANGLFRREERRAVMWTLGNETIERPQIWDTLHRHDPALRSAVWFPMLGEGCGADVVCMPAPVHNPDGSESLWCYSRPDDLYGTLKTQLGDFPLQHFWGPLANVKSSAWIADSAAIAAESHRPDFFYVYLPQLDYAAQKAGPDSVEADRAVAELDGLLGRLFDRMQAAYGPADLSWLVAGEYAITPVDHVAYPNRLLRDAGLLAVREEAGAEQIDFHRSRAWTLVDHQLGHTFVRGADSGVVRDVVDLFADATGIADVLVGDDRAKHALDHRRSGEAVLVSTSDSWQAYYWWFDDDRAPDFARTVDIHRKPGYDPVELHFDPSTRGIPLDATLVKGSHGAPALNESQQTVLIASDGDALVEPTYHDVDVARLVLERFGM